MESQNTIKNPKVKTTVLFERELIEEIDQLNPFHTRKEFLDKACKNYLKELRRKLIDEQLAKACSLSVDEDLSVNEEWEPITMEIWK